MNSIHFHFNGDVNINLSLPDSADRPGYKKLVVFDGRDATPEEQEVLSRYVGWGGLADAFDEKKDSWAGEFRELYAALSCCFSD